MVFERTEHEPEEHDPEADFHDPDSDSLTIPRVEPPAVREPGADLGGGDVPADVVQTFWIVVIVVNAAVLAVSLGVMLVAFRGDTGTGGGLVVGGLVLFGLAYRRYRAFRHRQSTDAERDWGGDDTEPADAESADDEPATGRASDADPETGKASDADPESAHDPEP
ncbi:DUF7322 domain-containing protein [Natronobeatus ordinarius]|uniref:DUF7322 domain-containing protein n=1 Tax=Natronobeatus ordinarius TaxID=2963433 RepID=UPI0020CCB3C5|nr:hypothetical protein [Natronobeatus ordinarius]